MFKHILLPTDGSPLSETAIERGIGLAKTLDARVTGLHVIEPFHVLAGGAEMTSDTQEQYDKDSLIRALRYLDGIAAPAKQAGVSCDCVTRRAATPLRRSSAPPRRGAAI